MITLKSFLLSVDKCWPVDLFSFKCITIYMDAQLFVLIGVVQENRTLTLTTNVSLLTILWTIRTFEIKKQKKTRAKQYQYKKGVSIHNTDTETSE